MRRRWIGSRAYHESLRAAVPELVSAVAAARKALSTAKLPEDRKTAIAKELDRIQADLEFVRRGNDIHNIHFAVKLMHILSDRVNSVYRELKLPEPKTTLPPMRKGW